MPYILAKPGKTRVLFSLVEKENFNGELHDVAGCTVPYDELGQPCEHLFELWDRAGFNCHFEPMSSLKLYSIEVALYAV